MTVHRVRHIHHSSFKRKSIFHSKSLEEKLVYRSSGRLAPILLLTKEKRSRTNQGDLKSSSNCFWTKLSRRSQGLQFNNRANAPSTKQESTKTRLSEEWRLCIFVLESKEKGDWYLSEHSCVKKHMWLTSKKHFRLELRKVWISFSLVRNLSSLKLFETCHIL